MSAYGLNPRRSRFALSLFTLTVFASLALSSLMGRSPVHAQAEDGSAGVGGDAGLAFRGFVQPDREEVLTIPVEGRLALVAVKEGQRVAKDEMLAKLDDRVQQAVVESATVQSKSRAELERAEQVLKLAELKHKQIKDTFKQGAATPLEVQEAELEVGQAKAQVQAAIEARTLAAVNLKLEERRLEQYELRAPFAGRVSRTHREAGASVTKVDEVITLTDLSTLKAVIHLPVTLYQRMAVGKTYKLRAGAPVNQVLSGKLTIRDPLIDTAAQTFRCVFELPNKDLKLPAGFTVDLLPPGK